MIAPPSPRARRPLLRLFRQPLNFPTILCIRCNWIYCALIPLVLFLGSCKSGEIVYRNVIENGKTGWIDENTFQALSNIETVKSKEPVVYREEKACKTAEEKINATLSKQFPEIMAYRPTIVIKQRLIEGLGNCRLVVHLKKIGLKKKIRQ